MLLLLYTLQGIPMGLAGALQLSVKVRGGSYLDVGTMKWMVLPYSMKLLWAPIVDAVWVCCVPRAAGVRKAMRLFFARSHGGLAVASRGLYRCSSPSERCYSPLDTCATCSREAILLSCSSPASCFSCVCGAHFVWSLRA